MQGLGQLTPFALTTPTGAGVGAGVGAGALRLAGSTALKQGVRRAAIGGAATSTITPEIGGQYTEQRGAGVSPEMAAAASIPGGIAAGAIDVIPQIRAARAVLNPGARSVRRAIGEDFVTEAGTEGIQEGIAIGSRAAVDPNFEVFTPENAARVGEALALGGLGGAVRGTGTAAGAAINRRAQNTAETRANIDARVAALRERLRGTPADQVDPSMVLTPEDAVAQLDALRERVRSGELTPEDASKEAQTISDMVYGGGETIEDDGAPSSDAFAVQNEDDGRVGGRAGTDDSEYFSTQIQPEGKAEYLYNRSGREYQATAANQYLNEGRGFESNALEKELSKLREKEDGYVYRPVSMREVLAADAKQQSESPDTQNAYLAQMGERKFNEVKDSNPRWADLYDPADPAAFLDNFHVIERKQVPPAVRPGDDLGLSAEDITPPMTPADKRRAGALRAQSKAGDLKAKDELAMLELKYENRRILRPPPKDKQVRSLREVAATTTDGKRVNINAMGLTAAMLNRVQSDAKLTEGAAPSADRIARAFTAGLSSLTEHGVDVGKLNIPDNTIVFSARTPGGGLRNYTYGEIRKSGRARLEQQVKDAEADVRRAEEALRRIPEGAEPARVTKAKRDLQNANSRLEAARGTLASTPLTKTEKATRTLIRGPKRKAQAEAAGNRGLAQYIEERMAAAREFLKAARQRAVLGPDARLVGLEERRARMARRLEAAKAKGDKTAIAELNEAIERADSDIADARKQRADRETGVQTVEKTASGQLEGVLETDVWSMEDALKELKAMRKQDFDYDAYSLPTLQKIASLRRLIEDALGLPMATLRERFTTAMGRKPTAAEDTPSAMLKALQARLGALMENKDGDASVRITAFEAARRASTLSAEEFRAGQDLQQTRADRAAFEALFADAPKMTEAQIRARYTEITGFASDTYRTVKELFAVIRERLAYEALESLPKGADPKRVAKARRELWDATMRLSVLRSSEGRIDLSLGATPSIIEELTALETPERTARLQAKIDEWVKEFKLPHKVRLITVDEALAIHEIAAVHGLGFSVRQNGELLIYVNPELVRETEVSILAHEFGHTLQKSIFDALPTAEQNAVLDEFVRWQETFDTDTAKLRELVKSKAANGTYEVYANLADDPALSALPPDVRAYHLSFDEWFADQTSRWLLGETKPPKGPVERFFAAVADALRRLVGKIKETDKEWGGSVFSLLEGMTGVGSGWASAQSPLEVLRAKNLALSAAIQKELRKIFPQRPDLDPADVAWLSVLNGNQTHTAAFRLALNELAPVLFSEARHAKLLKLTNGDIGAAFQQWAFGEKQTGDLGAEFERLHNQLEQVFETLVDQPVMDTLWQGQAELREHLTSLPPGSARLNAAGTARAAGFWGKAWGKVGGAAASLFVASDARLRATKIPAIIAVARHFQVRPGEAATETYPEAKTRHIGNFVNRARRIFDGKDKAFGAAVLEVLHNPNTLANAPEDVKAAAKRTWALMREMRDYMLEAGVELGDRGDQYFPWVFDTEYLQQHRAEFIAWIGQAKFAAGREIQTPTGTRTLTPEEIYSRLVGEAGVADVAPSTDPHAANFRSLNKRVLAFIETMGDESDRATLARFLSKDFGQVLGLYIDRAVKQAEYVRRFGAENEKLNEMLAEAKGQGATPEQIELAETMVMAHVGLHGGETAMRLAKLLRINPPQYGRPIDPRLQRVQSWAMVYQNLRVLSLSTITSLADVIGIGVRTGDFAIAFEGFRQGLVTSMSQHKEELSELAQALGIVDYTLTNEALGWEYGGMYLTGKAKRVNEWFFRAIGLQAWTRTTRVMALSAGRSFLVKHATNPNRNSARFLEELSLTPADILVSNGSLKVLSRAERKAATPEEVARDDRVRQALIRFVDGAILRPNASQRPLWMSDPHFALVGHLKGFMYAFHETILRRVAHEAKNGNLVPMLALSAFIPAMIAGDVLRDLIRHGGIPNFKQNWTALDYIQGALHRSGILGAYGTMGLDVAKDYNYGGVSVLGPTIDQLVNPDLSEVIPGQNVFKYWIRGGLPDASAASATGE
jgi:hypothetical protein